MVTDTAGAVVPKAKLTATHRESNITTTSESSEAGAFALAQLKKGSCDIRVQAAGFKEHLALSLMLVSLDLRRVAVALEVGAVDTRIEVTAGSTLIETEPILYWKRLQDAESGQRHGRYSRVQSRGPLGPK